MWGQDSTGSEAAPLEAAKPALEATKASASRSPFSEPLVPHPQDGLKQDYQVGFPGGARGTEWQETLKSSITGLGRSLEEEMATYSSILAQRILWTKDLGRPQSMVSQSAGHDLVTEKQVRGTLCKENKQPEYKYL